ncbi:MAG: oxidoreductase [Limnohabitans sp.]
MAAIPQPLNTTAAAVVAWRERTTDQSHRPHLGASLIGHECDRFLWLTFRWAGAERFDGRMLRLFDTGKREEPRVYEELRGIGCEVHADDGTAQFRVATLGGHFGGSLDGAVLGLPEAPKTWHVVEIKTHSDKLFAELVKKGVREAKPMHWVQMQTYMHLTGMDRALYYAVNKNTDALHIERVERDAAEGERIVAKAKRIIEAATPPAKLSEDPAWFACKWCRFHGQCHGTQAPEVNCRTCVHATPVTDKPDALWHCERGLSAIQAPREAHPCHLYIPPLLAALGEPVDADDESVTYQARDGARWVNGPAPGFASVEIHKSPAAVTSDAVRAYKDAFPGAKVIG